MTSMADNVIWIKVIRGWSCLLLLILTLVNSALKLMHCTCRVRRHCTMEFLKCLDIKWAVTLHSDSLKTCYFYPRGGVTLHYTAGCHFKKTNATSEVSLQFAALNFTDLQFAFFKTLKMPAFCNKSYFFRDKNAKKWLFSLLKWVNNCY